jgi:hypothetical protein
MPQTSGQQLQTDERYRLMRVALERRLQKVSLRAIADELNVTIATVRTWIREMTQTMLPQQEIEELRAHEAAGLDESEERIRSIIAGIKKLAAERETERLSISTQLDQLAMFEDRLERIRKQRAQLLGLNVPMQVKHNITVRTEFDAEVEALASDLLGGGNLMTTPEMIDVGEESG